MKISEASAVGDQAGKPSELQVGDVLCNFDHVAECYHRCVESATIAASDVSGVNKPFMKKEATH